MRLKEYFIDKKNFIIFYIVLMIFISMVVYLDGTINVSIENIIYINMLAITLFIIYFFSEYVFLKRYYSAIKYAIDNKNEDIINYLPEAKNNNQYLINSLIKEIYEEQQFKIEKFYEEKKENSEFVTSWVHEIKTPIAVSRLTIENSFNMSKEEVLNSIEEEIDKIDNYVEQALYHSKIDDFSKDYLINENNLEKIVKHSVKKNAKTFINKRIKIEMEDLDFNITTDKKWLGFIIDQILSNSLKYTDKSGRIKITSYMNNKEKVVVIEDNGIGIKEEDVHRVFNKGFTGYNGRGEYKSTGMGLYLAKQLAGKLGHDISIESSYGEYTKVKIHFPKLTDYFNVTKM